MAFVNEWPSHKVSEACTIDRERNIVLKSEGGTGSTPGTKFLLMFEDKIIRFSGYYDFIYSGEGREDSDIAYMHWDVPGVRIKKELQPRTQEICQVIKEALDAHGMLYRRNHIPKVVVSISEKNFIYS